MKDRFQKLGIKQTIQRHWMDHTVQMMLAGMSVQEIRGELDNYLSTQKQSGGTGERGKKTYSMAIAILASWFSPAASASAISGRRIPNRRHTATDRVAAIALGGDFSFLSVLVSRIRTSRKVA